MAFNTTAALNTPDLKRLPISALHPGLPSLATQSIVSIVTLVWPYSSSTRSCALLLAEPDFRLRRRRGQVRVQFFADAAHAVATSGVGIGDVVVLRLGPGVQWLASSGEEEVVRTPGKSVEWELGYRRALRLRAWRDGELLASLDVRGEQTPERQVKEVEEDHVYNTPSRIVGHFSGEGLKMGSWASPAFLKRSRLSLDSVRDSQDLFADDDGYVEGKGRKKRKSWMNVGMWTYANRTPSPEKGEVVSADEDIRPVSEDDVMVAPPADILHTPESTKTTSEANDIEEPVFEHPAYEPVQDHVEISPSAAPREAVSLLREEAIDQQYLTETSQPGFVRGDTEENTEVDELLSEPEERMEGQLSFQELQAIEQDESSTEEDEPPLLVPGTLPQSQVDDHSGDTEEDSDDAFLQVTELNRSLTPTEIDSDEDEEVESEEESDGKPQDVPLPQESLPQEGNIKTPSRESKTAKVAPEPQSSANRDMLPPVLRPIGVDESATRTPPRTPKPSAQDPDHAPPTPQLQPVTSINLPLPSPFPGTSTSEPTSYMDARPLPEAQELAETENSTAQGPQKLPVVEEERDLKEVQLQDVSSSVILPVDPSLHQTQISTHSGLDGLKELQALTEPFQFGLDGSGLSRIGFSGASDADQERLPAANDTEEGRQDDVAKSTTASDPTAVAPETLSEVQGMPSSKEPWTDILMQDKLEGENLQPSQIIVTSEREGVETPKRTLELSSLSTKDQTDGMLEDQQPAAQDLAQTVRDNTLEANKGPIFQDTVDDFQPQSLSFDDGYMPMIDDWEMPILDSDPVDDTLAEHGAQGSFAPSLEEDREKTVNADTAISSPKPEVEDVEKPSPESPPKPAKPEVTIIDLDSDTKDESDTERATPNEERPQAIAASLAPASAEEENIQKSLKSQMKPVELETPRKPSSQLFSPSKTSQQRLRTPFSDVDHFDLSQSGTPRRLRPIATPASQASSIADRVSSRRRRTRVKDSECEWDSTASVSTQKPSSPPSEAADANTLGDDERHSESTTTQVPAELPQQSAHDIAEKSSPPAEASRLRSCESERYSSPFTSKTLEELSQKPLQELSQRQLPFLEQSKQSPPKPLAVSSIEGLPPSPPQLKQQGVAQLGSSEKVHKSLPTVEQSSRAPSEMSQHVGEGSPAQENFRNVVRDFVRSSSPLPEHVELTPKKQAHSSMLVDDPSMMRALQTSQAPFSIQLQNRTTSSLPMEDSIPTFDSTQAENTPTQKRVPSPERTKSEAVYSAEHRDLTQEDLQIEDDTTSLAKAVERSQALSKAPAGNESATRPVQESLLTPEPSQQTALMPSSFPAAEIEQILPPTRRLTQASHVAEGFDLTQAKAKTPDGQIIEPTSPHEQRADTTMGDTTLVKPPAGQLEALHRAEPTPPTFSVKSVDEEKSPSPTFAERVRLHESSQPDMPQRSVFSQSQGLRTSLGYFTSLSSLPQHLNSQALMDVLAVCTRGTKRPERATAGPKDYFTSFRIADESLDVDTSSVQVQVFRPWKAALPECDVGDAVLLRNFVLKSRKGTVGLISGAESAWCVFRYGKDLSQRAAKENQSKPQINGEGENEKSQHDDKDEGKKGKRRSNIMDSLRPIWADTMSGLWGDLTGVVDGLDDEDASGAKNDNEDGPSAKEKNNGQVQEETSDLEHGRYNPESGASREECHGPPVEYGDQERRQARRLREWWVGGNGGGGGGAVAKANGDL
ncbi:uncharacterized protein IWZ02DRAFT_456664 [Phyllosticta citriasiana]